MNSCSRLVRRLFVLYALACFHLLVARAADPVPTVTTDLEDYAPFSFVQITGTGFQPGEIVNNQVVQVEGPAPGLAYDPWSVTADAQGGFHTTWYVFTDDLIGTTLRLTSTGQASGLTAIATFNDSATTCPPPPTGAPLTGTPAGGFAMDGDLQANASTGDWVPGSGSGGAVMTTNGTPLNPTTTFHLTDGFGAAENNFNGGLKVDDDPNLWTWVINPTTGKDDINHALIHISTASDGHRWLVVSADRSKNNGDSYVDFEFLQNSLSITTNSGGITGGFTSGGPHGGRTTNDFLLTISFTRGGTTPGVCLERWLASGTGFDYVDSPLPAGFVYGAVNTSVIPVPYGAFGLPTYDVNTFAEVAVDVTQLMAGFDRCLSVGVKSIMVKTKTSQSPQASIVDFIAPLSIDLKLGPTADAGPDQAKCSQGASTTFTLDGKAYAGLDPIISTNWSVVSGSATIDSTHSLTTSVHVSSASATLRLRLATAVEAGCAKTDDVVLTVNQPPSCSITGAAPVCPSSTNTYSGPDAMDSYSWSISGNGTIVGSTSAQNVDVNAGSACNQNFTLTLTTTKNGCANTCSQNFLIQDTTKPTVTKGSISSCYPDKATAEAAAVAATTATDNCPGDLTMSASTVGTCSAVITVRGTDACSNYAEVTYNTRIDNAGPVFSGLPAATLNLQCLADASLAATVTANDDCDGSRPVSFQEASSGTDCNKSIVRTWTASDTCGHTTTFTQTITVKDETNPTVTKGSIAACYADLASAEAAAKAATSVSDNCSAVTKSASTAGTCSAVITVRGTDACGNYAEVSYNTRIDNAGPVFSGLPDATLNVQCLADVPTATVTANDDCDGSRPVSFQETSSGTDCNKSILRTWTASDTCGHTTTFTQTVTVKDETNPTVTKGSIAACYSDLASAESAAKAATSVSDNCSTVTKSASTTGTCSAVITVRGTDACGNYAEVSYNTRIDNAGPVFSGLPDATLNVQCLADVPTAATVTANDDCDGSRPVSLQETPSGTDCNKSIVRTWTASDTCGHTTTVTQTITVTDTTPPVITCPINITVTGTGSTSTNATGVATATDNCDRNPLISYSDTETPGDCANTRLITRTWTATDSCGNAVSCVQKITVSNTTPPTIRCPATATVECNTSTDPSVTGRATATSSTGADLTASYSDSSVTGNCPNTKVIKRTWTATDACGITASCAQTINVVDTTAPRITCPADTTVDCNASTDPSATGSATATDNCDPQPTISHRDAVTGVCPKIITRTWTATDCAGHSSSCAQKITIADTAAPVITCPTNTTVQEYTSTDPSVTGRATAVDNCDPAPTISYSDVTNSVEPIVITRTWTATDCTGNRSVCTQTITVLEETNGGGTLITDTMRCTLPNNQLRLIFSPDTKNISCYKLTASNPGQFYFNVLYPGAPGSSLTFHVTLPYPWVTQGAKPIEVYDGVTINTSGGQTCLTPGKKIFAGSQQVTLSNYVKPVMGVTTYSFDVTVTVPPTGFVFLAIHLDYGLKASTGYGQNGATDATACGSTGILVPNGQPYTFSVSGAAHDSSTVSSYNTFKKNPGTGGLAQSQTTTFSVPGATAALKDAKGTVLGTGVTDQDGWYLINYKATGKATSYYLTLTPPKGAGAAQTQTISLKANGYVEADFTTP